MGWNENDTFTCELMMFNMCKERDKYRTCILPRCCNICPKKYDNECPVICTVYKEKIENIKGIN